MREGSTDASVDVGVLDDLDLTKVGPHGETLTNFSFRLVEELALCKHTFLLWVMNVVLVLEDVVFAVDDLHSLLVLAICADNS